MTRETMKCNYCEKTATYSFGWVFDDGYHANYSCDECRYVANARQQNAIFLEEIRQKSRRFSKQASFFEFL